MGRTDARRSGVRHAIFDGSKLPPETGLLREQQELSRLRILSEPMRVQLALFVSAFLAGCGEEAAPKSGARREETATLAVRPSALWLARGRSASTQFNVPVRAGLPSDHPVRAVAWGDSRELWISFDGHVGRISDPSATAEIEVFPMPSTPDGDALESQVLAPRGPRGRMAVATPSGYVAVSASAAPATLRALPMRSEPWRAGLMPWVGWTGSGALTASVHLTCDVVALDPDTGIDVWRRTEQVARYPSGSPNGKFLLLPWAEANAAAEVLDAATGKTISSLPNSDSSRVYGAVDDAGRWVVQGRYDAELVVWETTSNSFERVRMEGEGAQPIALAFLPGTTRCVVAAPNALWVLEATSRKWLAHWTAPAGVRLDTFVPLSDLAVSGDGSRIAIRMEGALLVFEVNAQR